MAEAGSRLFATPTPVVGIPLTFSIPTLGIETAIESVGLNSFDLMDVPANSDNVAWYNLGPKPGQTGSAVIDGHYDDRSGPAVFYNLKNLKTDDLIFVTDSNSRQQKFKVISVELFPADEFPLERVFVSRDNKSYLNLITCDGIYESGYYSHRLVVFTQKIE